jgi:hypothetical protein
MSILLSALYAALFLFIIIRSRMFRFEELPAWFMPAVFVVKLLAGVALWYIYTYYYTDRNTSDIWKYFDDSEIMFRAVAQSPADYLHMLTGIGDDTPHITQTYYQKMSFWYQQFDSPFFNDGRTMIRLNALLRLFSFGNYHVHTVIMCFVSLAGLTMVYRTLRNALQGWGIAGAAVIFLLPSVVFWGSGVLKESLLWFAVGGLLWAVLSENSKYRWLRIAAGIAAAWLIAATRLYVLAALLPALGGWMLAKRFRLTMLKAAGTVLLVVGALLLLLRIWPQTDAVRMMALKRNDFINLARGGTYMYDSSRVIHLDAAHHDALIPLSDTTVRIRSGTTVRSWKIAGDFMDTLSISSFSDSSVFRLLSDLPRAGSLSSITYMQPEVGSLLKIMPGAMYSIMLRPLPHEVRSLPLVPAAAETVLLLVLCVLLLFTFRKNPDASAAAFCLVFVALLYIVTGITTPVTGAAVRYKSIALPFLFALLLMYINPKRLPAFLQKLFQIIH